MQSSGGVQIHLDATRAEHYRQFGTKLWNAARFVFSHVHNHTVPPLNLPSSLGLSSTGTPVNQRDLDIAERWILSRLAHTAALSGDSIRAFNLAGAVQAVCSC